MFPPSRPLALPCPSAGTFGTEDFGEEKYRKATGALQKQEAASQGTSSRRRSQRCHLHVHGTGLSPFPHSADVWDGYCTQIS